MRCIVSVSYFIVINGKIFDYFQSERGLRQGDPLSPYLFLICTEGLSAMLAKHQHDGLLNGIQANRNGPRVTHLFFTDDSILLAKADKEECKKVKNMLKLYEKYFGQMVNVNKSALFFNPNTRNELKKMIKSLFGVQSTENLGKYLGVPALVGRDRRKAF